MFYRGLSLWVGYMHTLWREGNLSRLWMHVLQTAIQRTKTRFRAVHWQRQVSLWMVTSPRSRARRIARRSLGGRWTSDKYMKLARSPSLIQTSTATTVIIVNLSSFIYWLINLLCRFDRRKKTFLYPRAWFGAPTDTIMQHCVYRETHDTFSQSSIIFFAEILQKVSSVQIGLSIK